MNKLKWDQYWKEVMEKAYEYGFDTPQVKNFIERLILTEKNKSWQEAQARFRTSR